MVPFKTETRQRAIFLLILVNCLMETHCELFVGRCLLQHLKITGEISKCQGAPVTQSVTKCGKEVEI